MRRRLAIGAAAAFALLALCLAAEGPIERRLESHFTSALASSQHVGGSIESVEVCLPCLSYTIRGVDLVTADGAERAPLLRASAVDVGLALSELHRCAGCGEIVLHDAVLHVDIGREDRGEPSALGVEWSNIGRGLLPVPIDRIATEDAVLLVRYDRYREPIEWRFEIAEGLARALSDRGAAPRVALRGATPGGGRFEVRLDVSPAESERSLLVGVVSGVPLVSLDSYIEQRLGLDVEDGALSAKMSLEAMPGGWFGHVDCEITELRVFDPSDFWQDGPVQALKDGFAGAVSQARRDEDGALRLRVEIDRSTGSPESLWTTLGHIVRWLLVAPFTAPFGIDLPGDGS